MRAALVGVLARLGGERVEAARPVFALMAAEGGEEGRRTRLEAARLAERMPLPFDDALLRLLLDDDDEVAATAVRAVARHGAVPFVDALAARLSSPALAAAAADALAAAGGPAVEPLARQLADPRAEPACRRAAAGVLARIGGPDAEEALADRLLDGDAALRLRVLGALCALQERNGSRRRGRGRARGRARRRDPGPLPLLPGARLDRLRRPRARADRERAAQRDEGGARADLPAARPHAPGARLPLGLGGAAVRRPRDPRPGARPAGEPAQAGDEGAARAAASTRR